MGLLERRQPVVFAGENHMITLFGPGTDRAIASISCWRCTYSAQGEGFTLAMWCDPEAAGIPDGPATAVFTDNVAMSRMVMARLNQYFASYDGRGLAERDPTTARFSQQFGGRRFHRILCASDQATIELEWRDVSDGALEVFDNDSGPERFDVTSVICPCREGLITVNGVRLQGRSRAADHDVPSSSFLAFSETWVAQKQE